MTKKKEKKAPETSTTSSVIERDSVQIATWQNTQSALMALQSYFLPPFGTFCPASLVHPPDHRCYSKSLSFCPIHGRPSPPSSVLLPRTHLVCASADTLPPQIASHLYSVVLHTATGTDGSHSCLLNYARASLSTPNERAGGE